MSIFDKHFSIVLVPRQTKDVKKIKVPVVLFTLVILIVLGFLSGLTYIVMDYLSLRSQLAGMEQDEKIYNQQQQRIGIFQDHFREFQTHFDHLDSLNSKLKSMVMANIEMERKARRLEAEQAIQEKIKVASESSILDVIASSAFEADAEQMVEKEVRFQNLVSFFQNTQNPYNRIPNDLPVEGYLIDDFGMHTDPYTGQISPQNGIDIASRLDAPIRAPAQGVVLEIRQEESNGNFLVIDHGNGFITRYGHISRYEVDIGDIVEKGSVVALVGNSGHTTGPRLYYEVLFNNIPQNPVKYIYD